jgi:asparagine synthase (glutamine-hydrolysing)
MRLKAIEHASAFVCWMENIVGYEFDASRTAEEHYDCKVLSHGYIAHRAVLITELGIDNGGSSISDACVFAAAYRRWGSEFQRHILGEYCVAIFDNRSKQLLATHDALGLRPLWYTSNANRCFVGSHLDDLVRVTGDYKLNENYLAQYLTWGQHFETHTVYDRVHLLPGGSSLLWREGQWSITRTWSLEDLPTIEYRHEGDYLDHFLDLLSEAVMSASSGRTWVDLSGGLDSSTITSIAALSGAMDLEAVSIVYPRSRTADEREWMKEVIAKYALPWHTLNGDAARPFSWSPDSFIAEPCRTIIVWRLFREYQALARNSGVEVILSGLGGDQAMLGDSPEPLFLADEFRALHWSRLHHELVGWRNKSPEKRSLLYLLIKNAVVPWFRYVRRRSLIFKPDADSVCPWLEFGFRRRTNVDAPSPTLKMPSVASQYYCERIGLVSLSAGQFWNQFVTSFQIRYPLLYRPLVEFMYAVPWNQKLRPGEDRSLQRRALTGILPDKIRLRTNKRFPDQAFFEGLKQNRELYSQLETTPHIVRRGYVNGARWKEALRLARVGRVRALQPFLAACTLEIWLRQFD